MERRGRLNVPVIGVARTKWTLKQFRARVADSVREHGTPADRKALPALLERMGYVAGEYHKRTTYVAIRPRAGRRRAPDATTWRSRPACSPVVVEGLARSGCAKSARLVVEKPFGRDLASARELNRTCTACSTSRRSSASITTWARSRCRTCWCSASRTRSSSRSGTALHRERADHDGGDVRRRDARALLRGGGRDPRRRPEPPVAGGRRCWRWSRRSRPIPIRCATRR